MIAVAADNAYLFAYLALIYVTIAFLASSEIPQGFAYHVKMYCVWLFLRFTSAGRPIGMPAASLSYALTRSGSTCR